MPRYGRDIVKCGVWKWYVVGNERVARNLAFVHTCNEVVCELAGQGWADGDGIGVM